MSILIESLKLLFENGDIPLEKIDELLKDNTINKNEYEYIINE